MLFEKPSLRTRVSFETGVHRMGGHAIFYNIADSPLGKKESIEDTAKVLSRYVDVIMARVMKREDIAALAQHATVPVVNGLDDFAHPCQILTDLFTIVEKKGSLERLKVAYLGDIRNNVTYDWMRAACLLGIDITVAGPNAPGFLPEQSGFSLTFLRSSVIKSLSSFLPLLSFFLFREVIDECNELCKRPNAGSFKVVHDPREAAKDADVIYTDSWMSYHISKDEAATRIATLK